MTSRLELYVLDHEGKRVATIECRQLKAKAGTRQGWPWEIIHKVGR